MAYWWVSQSKTYYEERNGGYLWAPKYTRTGRTIYHWETMKQVKKDDIIFSYVKQHIVAYSIAQGVAYDSKNPFRTAGEAWENDGRKIDVSYIDLSLPIYLPNIVDEFLEILKQQKAHKPLNINGTGNQGYLFPLIDEAGKYLLSKCDKLNV